MKARSFLLPFVSLTLLAFCSNAQIVATFDDTQFGPPAFYQGLFWNNFATADGITRGTQLPGFDTNGYYYGMVSLSHVVYNYERFAPADVYSVFGGAGTNIVGMNINFLGAYLTGLWRSNLNIEVQGFRAGSLVYDQTVVASATNATFFPLNYMNIDRVKFSSLGGENAGFGGDGPQYTMDNFTFEVVPEPSALLLTCVGALLLLPFIKRKRA
jgi:hypothetical protein